MQTEDRSSSQQVFEESWEVESLGTLIVASLSAGFRRPDGLHSPTATLPHKDRLATMHVPTIYPNGDLPRSQDGGPGFTQGHWQNRLCRSRRPHAPRHPDPRT